VHEAFDNSTDGGFVVFCVARYNYYDHFITLLDAAKGDESWSRMW